MTRQAQQDHVVHLRYLVGLDVPERGIFFTRPQEPEFTSELRVTAYIDGVDPDPLDKLLRTEKLQVQLGGSSRALEALGTFLIALARLDTQDPRPHEHLEDVQGQHGERVHLIIRREPP
jgi:hypothetical protein